MKTEICAIFAIGPDNVIGIEDKMPWHSKQDFYHYKQVTKGYPCIFGEKTFLGLPKYPLSDRLNICVNLDYKESSVVIDSKDLGGYIKMPTIEDAIRFGFNYSKIFICGGRSIYKYCLENNLIDTIYLTEVSDDKLSEQIKQNPDKYIRFPLDIKEYIKDWEKTEILYGNLPNEDSDIKVKFLQYVRK